MVPGLSTGGGGFSASESDSSTTSAAYKFGDTVNNKGGMFGGSKPPDYKPIAVAAAVVSAVFALYLLKK